MGELSLELWQLELRYVALRTQGINAERRLLASLLESGQQVPIVVFAEAAGGFVVVDGYKRVRCARKLRWDTVRATSWDLGEADALILERVLRSAGSGNALEEGWYLRELSERFGLSQQELARRFSRSVSWVSRRLSLVGELPQVIQQGVLTGQIAAHAAMKFLVPLARANRADCLRLYDLVRGRELSSRQMGRLWAAYRSGGKTRELLLQSPGLVLKIDQSVTTEQALFGELLRLRAGARRARQSVEQGVRLEIDERHRGYKALERAQADVQALMSHLEQEGTDAGRGHAHDGAEAEAAGARHTADRSSPRDLAGSGSGSHQERHESSAGSGESREGRGAP